MNMLICLLSYEYVDMFARFPKDRGSSFRGTQFIFCKPSMLISCIVVNTKKGEIERACAIPI